jgi:hypothetical protein
MNREKIAELCHEQWSGWMEYLFSKCRPDTGQFDRENGCLIIPKSYVDRWKRQMITKYHDLTEAEKESDRKEADKFLYYLNLGRLTFDE